MVEECKLAERLCQGDRHSLELIYDYHQLDLLRIGSCMLANRTDAEDCLHDVFVSLAANSTRIRPDGNLKGYLVTAMANPRATACAGSNAANMQPASPTGSAERQQSSAT